MQNNNSRFRYFIAWMLVLTGCVCTILGCLSVYVKKVTLDTDTFVKTVGPIIKDPVVAGVLSEKSAELLFNSLKIDKRLQNALPKDLGFIAEPVSGGLQDLVEMTSEEILMSDPFYTVWESVLKASHAEAVKILTNRSTVTLSERGEVALDVGALLNELREELADDGIVVFKQTKVPEGAGEIILFEIPKLGRAKQAVNWLQKLYWVPPVLAVVLFALAILAAKKKRTACIWLGSGLVLSMLALLGILSIAKVEFLGTITDRMIHAAAVAVWNRGFHLLVQFDIWIIVLGFLIVLISLVTGPYKYAVLLRRKLGIGTG